MAKHPDKNEDSPLRPGPVPDHVKLDDENWEEAVRKAIKKPKPAGGWPKAGDDDAADKADDS